MRLEMLHSYWPEQVCGLGNQPTFLHTPWQFKKGWWVITQAIMNCHIKGEGAGVSMCKSIHPTLLQVWLSKRFPPQRMPLGMVAPNVNHCHVIPQGVEDCNRCQRDQRLPSPQLPSPSPDQGFKSGLELICCPGLIDQTDAGIPDEGDSTKKMPIWR